MGIYENQAKAVGKVDFRPAMLCMLLLLTWMCMFQRAGAAGHPYESRDKALTGNKVKIAKYYFWQKDYQDLDIYYSKAYSGQGKKLVDLLPGESLNGNIISNGVYVYYAKKRENTTQVCRVAIKTGKTKQIGSYTGDYELEGYYNGKAYVSECYETVCHTLYTLNLKTGKFRKTFSDPFGECKQYGQYFICRAAHGDPSPTKLFVYNAKTGKRTRIAKKAGYFAVVDGLLYYTEFGNYSGDGIPMSIKRVTLKGKNKKTLVAKAKVSMAIPVAFRKTYAIYWDTKMVSGNARYFYYKASYGSGRIKETKKEKYDKLSAMYQY